MKNETAGMDPYDLRRTSVSRRALNQKLKESTNEDLLKTFAALTHRLHVADRAAASAPAAFERRAIEIRIQRDLVEAEILKRMKTWKEGCK